MGPQGTLRAILEDFLRRAAVLPVIIWVSDKRSQQAQPEAGLPLAS
jgi:hypothetical protein